MTDPDGNEFCVTDPCCTEQQLSMTACLERATPRAGVRDGPTDLLPGGAQRLAVLERVGVVLGIEGLHVPLVDEPGGQGEPRLIADVRGSMSRGPICCQWRAVKAQW